MKLLTAIGRRFGDRGRVPPITTEGLLAALLSAVGAVIGVFWPFLPLVLFVGVASLFASVLLARQAIRTYCDYLEGLAPSCFTYDVYRSLAQVTGGNAFVSIIFLVNPEWMQSGTVAVLYAANLTLGILLFALSQAGEAKGKHAFHGEP